MPHQKATRMDYVRSETDVFSDIGYDVSVNSSMITEYHPTSAISSTSPIEFFIQGNDTQYIDLSRTRIKLRLKVVSAAGKNIANQPDVAILNYAPANYIVASAFEGVKVYIHDTEVTTKNSLYPYQAYLETLLSYGSDFKKGQAEAGGFFRVKNETTQTDDGWVNRKEMCNASKSFEVIGRPHSEVFNQTRYMMPGVDIRIQFNKSADSFALECHGTGKENIKLQILEAKLYVRKLTLLPSIQLAHLKTWKETPVKYPGTKVSMKSYSLPVGTFQHTNESLLNGLIPQRLILGILDTKNVQGDYSTNPFSFENHGLQQIIITCNAEQTTQHIINVDKDEDRLLDGFISLYDAMGITNCDAGLDLRVSEYKNGKSLYGFDLRDISEGHAIPRHGNVSIYLKFKNSLTASLTVIVYPEYPSNMYITNDKRVFFKDYASEY